MDGFKVEEKGGGGLVHVDEALNEGVHIIGGIPYLAMRWLPDTNARQIAITLGFCIAYASNSVMGPVLSANFFVGASTALSIETNRFANGIFFSPSK